MLFYGVALVVWLVPFVRDLSPNFVNGDFLTWFFWLPALRHPGLYAGDLLASSWRPLAPPVLLAFYQFFGAWLPWVTVSKILSAGVVLAFFAGAWSLGRTLFPGWLARCLFAAWIAGAAGTVQAMQGGIPRGFGPPVQVWLLVLLLRRRPVGALVVLVAAALLHSISFLLLAPVYLAWCVFELRSARDEDPRLPLRPRALLAISLATVAACIGMLALQSRAVERQLGPMISRADALGGRPEWQPGGRFHYESPHGLARDFWHEAATRLQEKPLADQVFQLFLLALLPIGGWLFLGKRLSLPPILAVYLLAAIAGYGLAYWLLPRLYAPNRYLQVPALLLPGVFAAAVLENLSRSQSSAALRWSGRGAALLFAVLAFVGGLHYSSTEGFGPGAPVGAVSAWLRAHLATGEMYAAFPKEDADSLLLPTERPCLMAYKCDQGLYRSYLDESSRRLRLLFRAYYAFDRSDVEALARRTPARYLVIRRSDLGGSAPGRLYPHPHAEEIRAWAAAHAGRSWFWTGSRAPRPVFEDPVYQVFELTPFRAGR